VSDPPERSSYQLYTLNEQRNLVARIGRRLQPAARQKPYQQRVERDMAGHPTAAELTRQAREAGYTLVRIEQLRTNRWLLTLTDAHGAPWIALAQQRPLVTAADVQDLADMLSLQRCPNGLLLALGGRFSPEARRTAAELCRQAIHLCTALPTTSGDSVAQGNPAKLDTVTG
jgi:hypothetical protein